MMRYADKRVVVTGGASGIGLATARRLFAEGATLALVDLEVDGARRGASAIDATGVRVAGYGANVADSAAVTAVLRSAEEWMGGIDVVVNSAGIIARGAIGETSDEAWRRVVDIDLSSMFYVARAVAPAMRRAGRGAIVNVASVAGSVGAVNVAYAAAKGGVIALTRQLANELSTDSIRVNSVSPGFTATPLNQELRAAGSEAAWANRIPLGRFGLAEEIAAVCAFLGSDDASYITGIDLVADGGLSAVARPDFIPAGAAMGGYQGVRQ